VVEQGSERYNSIKESSVQKDWFQKKKRTFFAFVVRRKSVTLGGKKEKLELNYRQVNKVLWQAIWRLDN